MSSGSRISTVLAVVILAGVAWTPAVEAQTATAPSGGGNLTELPLPRNNVKAGALSANAPGNWVRAGIANHNDFNTRAFDQFGGATIDAPSEEDASLKEQLVPSLVDAFLNALDSLVSAIQAVILAGGTVTATSPS